VAIRAAIPDPEARMTPINPSVFKAYDVRGIYPTEVTAELFHQLGRAFVAYLGPGRFAVTRDMRVSSPELSAAFIAGARAQGGHIVDYGLMGTDLMYFAVAADGLDGGAQVTASHNPGEYNGCKMVRREAFPLSGEAGIKEMKEMILNGTIPPPTGSPGTLETRDALDRYTDHVMGFIDASIVRPFGVVLDAGSGIAGLVAPRLFDRLPCRTTRLCFEVDGTFPNHEANPLIEENRRDITAKVIEERSDAGIAWDGDADRCFFLDGTGEFIAGDFITALLAESFLMKRPGSTIVYDVRASYAVKDIVAKYGGQALMNRVGHAFIKRRMREADAIFGGEVTGHYYFRDNFYADNGFIPALLILELMSKKGLSLRDLLKPLRERYFISGEINTKMASMALVPGTLDRLKREYRHGHVYELDGVSVEFGDWHFNVRASNTEPLLRLNLEGETPEIMERRRDEVLGIIRG
jgi:phosphomannomutase